jgi:hypothetical protein
LARTHYGDGVDVRRSEDFDCEVVVNTLRCTIRSVRQNGQRVVGQFEAGVDGSPGGVSGISGMDSVRILRRAGGVADATFSLGGKPVFGYRAYRSPTEVVDDHLGGSTVASCVDQRRRVRSTLTREQA